MFVLFQKIKDIPVGPSDSKEKTTTQKLLSRGLWFISTARNILVVVVCAMMAYVFHKHDMEPFKLSGK
ncbi:unnamed protein product, partial [Nesidiocoris tenuis]